jgi:hypothetical protein
MKIITSNKTNPPFDGRAIKSRLLVVHSLLYVAQGAAPGVNTGTGPFFELLTPWFDWAPIPSKSLARYQYRKVRVLLNQYTVLHRPMRKAGCVLQERDLMCSYELCCPQVYIKYDLCRRCALNHLATLIPLCECRLEILAHVSIR